MQVAWGSHCELSWQGYSSSLGPRRASGGGVSARASLAVLRLRETAVDLSAIELEGPALIVAGTVRVGCTRRCTVALSIVIEDALGAERVVVPAPGAHACRTPRAASSPVVPLLAILPVATPLDDREDVVRVSTRRSRSAPQKTKRRRWRSTGSRPSRSALLRSMPPPGVRIGEDESSRRHRPRAATLRGGRQPRGGRASARPPLAFDVGSTSLQNSNPTRGYWLRSRPNSKRILDSGEAIRESPAGGRE